MPETRSIRCDGEGCEAMQKSENHWWILRIRDGVATVIPMWLSANESGDFLLCGESCVSKKLSKWMSAQAR